MKKKWIKPLVLITLFIGAVVVFGIGANRTNEDLTTNMAEATLPILRFYYQDIAVNEQHGYRQKMDVTAMRGSVMPLTEDRSLSLSVSTYGVVVDRMFYEVRSLDGQRLVSDGELMDYTLSGREISAQLTVENLILENEEYMLILQLDTNIGPLYYYTRIMQAKDCYVDECLKFARQFHDYTFRKDAGSFIPTYMDPATGDATTLHYVDLSCTLKQITWANFKGQKLTEPVISFQEINASYNILILEYVMVYVNEDGETEYYNIEEYYRLRQTTTRMYVLNFERTMNQIFRGENDFIYNKNEIQLGIRDSAVEYKASDDGNVVCFVQEGDLWCYNAQNGDIIRVFSFRGIEGMDVRENYGQHDIKIAGIDEAGSIDFIVYGYMNRGSHEGEVGIGVYYYDGLAHTVEEELFLPFAKSFDVLQAEMGQLMYANEMGELYLMMEGTLYEIDLNRMETEVIIGGLQNAGFAISSSNRYFAWVDNDRLYQNSVIHLKDFKNQSVHDITAPSDSYLMPLGFMGEDFIYGIAKKENVAADAAGGVVFPMDRLMIMSVSQSYEVKKVYRSEGYFVDSIRIREDTIDVNLTAFSDGIYVSAGTDMIRNRDAQTEAVMISKTVTGIKETEVQICLQKNTGGRPQLITPKDILLEDVRVLNLPEVTYDERYYVYAKGKLIYATDNLVAAILSANESMGVVTGARQQYVWMRAKKTYQNAFSGIAPMDQDQDGSDIVKCISAMLKREGNNLSAGELFQAGYTPKEVLETTLKDYTVIELTGCSVNEVLYYVSRGKPVFAMAGGDHAVLIIGYTNDRISYYDPSARGTHTMRLDEAVTFFENSGNIFLTYYKDS